MNFFFFFVALFIIAIQMPETFGAKCEPGTAVGIGWGWGCPVDGGACDAHCRGIKGAEYTSGGCNYMDCTCRC
uniref:Defensin n=1 Tax=Panagrolaimus davidi TaxID=227884 RepID=A0A914PWI3_9BILA